MNLPRRIVFLGTPAFAVPALEMLIASGYAVVCVTQPDKPAGRKRSLVQPAVKQAAQKFGLPVLQPEKLDETFLAALKDHGPFDVGIVVAYGKILKAPMLAIPKHGFLNIHASLLPRHRGASPVQSAIMAGDPETGVSIMLIDEGLDTGPVLAQQRFTLTGTETSGELLQQLAPIGASVLSSVVQSVLDGTAHAQPQEPGKATYTKLIKKDDARLYWKDPAVVSERKVRAFNPEPVAWAVVNEKKLNILRASLIGESTNAKPGTLVVLAQHNLLGVTCGDEKILVLQQVRLEGKTNVDGNAFFHGYKKFAGTVLL